MTRAGVYDQVFLGSYGKLTRPFHFGYTVAGYMDMSPDGSRPGDIVSIFFGSETPHVLRRRDALEIRPSRLLVQLMSMDL